MKRYLERSGQKRTPTYGLFPSQNTETKLDKWARIKKDRAHLVMHVVGEILRDI